MGGTEPQVISKAKQRVLARLMETQIWHPPTVSVILSGEGSEKGQWSLPALLSGRKLSSSCRLDARHFTSTLYASGAFQAATHVLELRKNESEEVDVCGFFKRNYLGLPKFLPPIQSPLFSVARNKGCSFLGTGTLGWGPGMGLGRLTPWKSLPYF